MRKKSGGLRLPDPQHRGVPCRGPRSGSGLTFVAILKNRPLKLTPCLGWAISFINLENELLGPEVRILVHLLSLWFSFALPYHARVSVMQTRRWRYRAGTRGVGGGAMYGGRRVRWCWHFCL